MIRTKLIALAARAGFRPPQDRAAFDTFVASIRMIAGAIALARAIELFLSARFYFDSTGSFAGMEYSSELWWTVALVLVTACTMLGFLTPLALIGSVIICYYADQALGTTWLGTQIYTQTCLLLLLTGAGHSRSMDVMLARRPGWRGAPARAALRILPAPSTEVLGVPRFLAFLGFAVISIGAMLHHFRDPYWSSGYTIEALMTSSYLSRSWEIMRPAADVSPLLTYAMSAASGLVQTFWEVFMVPLVFHRWGRAFVIWFGVAFFAVSLTMLQLSSLPLFEFVFWAALWVSVPLGSRPATVYFDDACGLCRRSISVLRAIDVTKELAPRPLSAVPAPELQSIEIDRDAALRELHGTIGGRTFSGYDLYAVLARRMPTLWPVWPLLLAGRIRGIGPRIYGIIAERRARTSACEILGPAPNSLIPTPYRAGHWVLRVVAGAWVAMFVLTLVDNPHVRAAAAGIGLPIAREQAPWAHDLSLRTGLVAPNVFNQADLVMGDVWPVYHRENVDGTWELVPFNGVDGERLSYHSSDILYFGNSLRTRRSMSPPTMQYGGRWANGILVANLDRVCLYDYRVRRSHGVLRYRIQLFESRASDLSLPPDEAREARRWGTRIIDVDGKTARLVPGQKDSIGVGPS